MQSTRAYTDGDKARARDLAKKSQEVLKRGAVDFDAEVLATDAAKGAAQAQVYDEYEPTAAPAQSAIKATKESYNVQSRTLLSR